MAADAGSIKAGGAYVTLGARDAALQKALDRVEARLRKWGRTIAEIGAGMSALGTAITAPALAAVKMFAAAGSELNDMSTRTGMTVESLSALAYAAQQTGTDVGALEAGFHKLQRTLSTAALGNQQAAEAFGELGLSAEALIHLKPEQQLQIIAARIKQIRNPTAQAAAAMAIFGRSGAMLLPLIAELDTLTAQAQSLGLVMSTEDARAADALGDSIDTITAQFRAMGNAIGAALAPELMDLASWVMTNFAAAIKWVNANRPLVVQIVKIAAAVVAAGAAVSAIGVALMGASVVVGGFAAAISGVATVLGAILSPIGMVAAGLGYLAAWFFTSTDAGINAFNELADGARAALETIRADFGMAMDGMSDALAAGDIALAGQILWQFLKVEWIRGTNYIKGIWREWSGFIVEVWQEATYKIASVMTDMWAGLQSSWISVSAYFEDGWAGLVMGVKLAANAIGAVFQKVWTFIKGVFAAGIGGILDMIAAAADQVGMGDFARSVRGARDALSIDTGAEYARIDRESAARSDQIQQETGSATLARQQQRAKDQARIEADRQGRQQALTDQQDAEREARRKAREAAATGDQDALNAAVDELARLTVQAMNEKAAKGAGKPLAGRMPAFGDIAEGIAQTSGKIEAAGSFSATALKGMGIGSSIAGDQLKEAKKQTKELEKLNAKQVAFAGIEAD